MADRHPAMRAVKRLGIRVTFDEHASYAGGSGALQLVVKKRAANPFADQLWFNEQRDQFHRLR